MTSYTKQQGTVLSNLFKLECTDIPMMRPLFHLSLLNTSIKPTVCKMLWTLIKTSWIQRQYHIDIKVSNVIRWQKTAMEARVGVLNALLRISACYNILVWYLLLLTTFGKNSHVLITHIIFCMFCSTVHLWWQQTIMSKFLRQTQGCEPQIACH